MPELQPYSSFSAFAIEPGKVSDLKLSGGRTIPYIYSLAVASSVPYVRLLGSSGGQKLFSWNEKILVPPGEMVTVQNASFHRGDIVIQSGWDPGAKPQRITVPVTFHSVPADALLGLPAARAPDFPADTRRCRRAYVSGFGATSMDPVQFNAIGIAKERSHVIDTATSSEAFAGPQYLTTISVPPFTEPGLLMLGNQAAPSDTIHQLLDATTFRWGNDAAETPNGALYYVLEYL